MEEPNYRKLIVWQKAHKNTILAIGLLDKCDYRHSRVIDQSLGAVTSIGANIAEGNASKTDKEKERYFRIALNSSYEFDNWIQVLKDSGICKDVTGVTAIEKQNIEIIKILCTIIKSLSS